MSNECPKCHRPLPEDSTVCTYCVFQDALYGDDESVDVSPDTQRDLIYCMFAVQMGCATAAQFIEAGAAWVTDPGEGLAEKLRALATIEGEKEGFLAELTNAAIKHHDGNIDRTIQELSLGESIDEFFEMSVGRGQSGKATKIELPAGLSTDYSDSDVMGEVPGRYTRRSEYSRGGMGRILLVHDEYLSRDIALKELLPDRLRPSSSGLDKGTPIRRAATMIARFLREAKITSQLEHPNIVPVYELGRRSDGTYYYTMKLIRGETFGDALENAELLEERLKLLSSFIDLCKAIAYAHSRQVIHRDLKPSNVMLGPFGETVVIDWGLAKVVGGDDPFESDLLVDEEIGTHEAIKKHRTKSGVRLGTPAYMSPEQARGEIEYIDARSDVYSLGAMLHEILTGETPFGNLNPSLQMRKTATEAVPRVHVVADAFPEVLADICAKALHFDATQRYADAGEMLQDLQDFVSGALVSAHDYSISELFKRFYERNRDAVQVGIVAAIVLVAMSVFSYVSIYRERDEAVRAQNLAEERGYANSIKLAQQYVDDKSLMAAEQVLDEVNPDRRRWEWEHLKNRAHPFLQQFEGAVLAAWLPGGDELLTVDIDGEVIAHNVETGSEIYRIETDVDLASGLALNRAATVAAVVSTDYRVHILDLPGQRVRHELRGHTGSIRNVAMAPDGQHAASASIDGQIILWDLDSGERKWMVSDLGRNPSVEFFDATGRYVIGTTRNTTRVLQDMRYQSSVWDVGTGEAILNVPGRAFGIAPDANRLYVYRGNRLHVYSRDTGEMILDLSGHDSRITSATLEDDGKRMVSCDEDGIILVRDTASARVLTRIDQGVPAGRLELNTATGLLLTVPQSGTDARVWDLGRGLQRYAVESLNGVLFDATFSPNGQRFVTTSNDSVRYTTVWNSQGSAVSRNIHRAKSVSSLSVSGTRLVVALDKGRNELLETDSATVAQVFAGKTTVRTNQAALLEDGDELVFKADNLTLVRCSTSDGKVSGFLTSHDAPITALSTIPESGGLVSASWDGAVRYWDSPGALVPTETWVEGDFVTAIARNHVGEGLLMGTNGGQILVWTPSDEVSIAVIGNYEATVTAIALSPNGTEAIVGSTVGNLSTWDLRERSHIRSVQGDRLRTRALEFGEKGQRVFSTSRTGGIKVWAWPKLESMLSIAMDETQGGIVDLYFEDSTSSLFSLSTSGYVTRWFGEAGKKETTIAQLDPSKILPLLAVVARGDLEFALERMVTTDSFGPVVTEVHPLRWIGLRPGEAVLQVNDTKIQNQSELIAALHAVLQGGELENMRITTRSENVIHECRWSVIEREEEVLMRTVALADLREAFERHGTILSDIDLTLGGSNTGFYALMGIELAEKELPHGILLYGGGEELWPYLRNLGLSPGDRMMEISGVKVISQESAHTAEQTVLEEIEAGTRTNFSIRIQRGEFRDVTIDYTVLK